MLVPLLLLLPTNAPFAFGEARLDHFPILYRFYRPFLLNPL